MSRKRVTSVAVRDAMTSVVEQFPGRKDPRPADGKPPRYVVNGAPHCFVAHVLSRLGWSVGQLHALDAEPGDGPPLAGVKIATSQHPSLRRVDPVALKLLAFVQARQDRGFTWASIVDSAFAVNPSFPNWDRDRKPWLDEIT